MAFQKLIDELTRYYDPYESYWMKGAYDTMLESENTVGIPCFPMSCIEKMCIETAFSTISSVEFLVVVAETIALEPCSSARGVSC